MNSRASTATALAALALLLFGAGCGSEGYEAGTSQNNKPPAQKKDTPPPVAKSPTKAPSELPSVKPVDVCKEVSPEDVVGLLGLPAGTAVTPKDDSAKAEPGLPGTWACQYTWKEKKAAVRGVRIGIVARNDEFQTDPKKVLKNYLGGTSEPLEGIGEVAGVSKTGPDGSMKVAAVQKTSRGLSSVIIQAPGDSDAKKLGDLAKDLLDKV